MYIYIYIYIHTHVYKICVCYVTPEAETLESLARKYTTTTTTTTTTTSNNIDDMIIVMISTEIISSKMAVAQRARWEFYPVITPLSPSYISETTLRHVSCLRFL